MLFLNKKEKNIICEFIDNYEFCDEFLKELNKVITLNNSHVYSTEINTNDYNKTFYIPLFPIKNTNNINFNEFFIKKQRKIKKYLFKSQAFNLLAFRIKDHYPNGCNIFLYQANDFTHYGNYYKDYFGIIIKYGL